MMFLNRQEENQSVQQTRLLEAQDGLAKGIARPFSFVLWPERNSHSADAENNENLFTIGNCHISVDCGN